MTVKYFADIRWLTRRGEETWTKAEPDLRALLKGITAQDGDAFEKRLFEGDRISNTIIIFINGRDVVHLNGLDSPLKDDDVVAVFPVVAGG